MNNKFTWNDLVVVKNYSFTHDLTEKIAVVCGMIKIKSPILANKYSSKTGEWLYTVEFGDGSSTEVPERFLKKYKKE